MKTKKWLYAAALGLLFASCESVETPMFSDEKDAFVAFNSKTTNILENSAGEVKIPVSMVASKAYDATVTFTIDASAYEEAGTAAKENVHYRVKNETNTLTFVAGGELTQYIVLEAIDNNTFDGNVYFDIKLEVVSTSINIGANYTTTVALQDDDHPLMTAGILGKYSVSAPSGFTGEEDVQYTWNCEITSDPNDVDGVWISQIFPNDSYAVYQPIYGRVEQDKKSIVIGSGQTVGSYSNGAYDLKLLVYQASSAVAMVGETGITIQSLLVIEGYDSSTGKLAGNLYAVGPVTMTKVTE